MEEMVIGGGSGCWSREMGGGDWVDWVWKMSRDFLWRKVEGR